MGNLEEADLTAPEFIEYQKELEEEARALMPWNPTKCTYELGPIRQQLYACRDHGNIALCYSCAIICHTTCDIVELFTKRNYSCDCGTERDSKEAEKGQDSKISTKYYCQLRKNTVLDIPGSQNTYGHNFQGLFCGCSKEYNPNSDAVMLQCVAGLNCNEDWYHDYCILGKDEVSASIERSMPKEEDVETDNIIEKVIDGFPKLDSFNAFICTKCTNKYDYYFEKLLSHELSETIFAKKLFKINNTTTSRKNEDATGQKRKTDVSKASEYSLFLKENYSDGFNKIKESLLKNNDDEKLLSFLQHTIPHLIEDTPVYEPIDEEEPKSSIHDLAMGLLNESVDRQKALSAIVAYHTLKDRLGGFFQRFADNNEVVKGEDIKNFFAKEE
ncbi:hypothetical protein TBLA_0A08750 [Henningerozyma blattae CBS 6284]|uniref:UBR-type domain-containing protein n=1 Tax=Henningerozyma blattae (strain ATCC 34711 / CBS 6284 / DSM 70876 / NBRC 10599 / NRRL Y-10934 / UCD 77-7) TaxID=1071380 RepID=I2GX12_HENB6|nr:hypothetical protein TBLA_0A08750 [Tetrapisispora blattae CBS 6284]CCH58664.1 hypothetical protein TBLA_0A08750 [Tetrapisispora blattae CBS 6284]